jgi:hypothetical protein
MGRAIRHSQHIGQSCTKAWTVGKQRLDLATLRRDRCAPTAAAVLRLGIAIQQVVQQPGESFDPSIAASFTSSPAARRRSNAA